MVDMELMTELQAKHSKELMLQIVEYIGNDHQKLDELWSLVRYEEPPIPQRGAWALSHSTVENQDWVDAHVGELVAQLSEPAHDAVPRAIAKILARTHIPEVYHGDLFTRCIDWMMTPTIPVAIKVHGMTIAFQIAQGIPELEEELSLVIRDQMEFNSPGFRARGKQILQKMKSS